MRSVIRVPHNEAIPGDNMFIAVNGRAQLYGVKMCKTQAAIKFNLIDDPFILTVIKADGTYSRFIKKEAGQCFGLKACCCAAKVS